MEALIPIAIIGGILNLILFIKVWGMTNNTNKIRAFLEAQRPDLFWVGIDNNYVMVEEE